MGCRIHGTTHRAPIEAWKVERSFLVRLPDRPFGSYRQEVRKVGVDGLLSWDGVRYSAPQHLSGTQVTVRGTPAEIEILDALGQRVAVHRISEDPARLVIDPAHQPPRVRTSTHELEEAMLRRFPGAAAFLDGLRHKAGSFAHLHLTKLRRLAQRFDEADLLAAIELATELRRFSAHAVARILERTAPEQLISAEPMGSAVAVLGLVEEDDDWVDFDHYRDLERAEPTAQDPDAESEGEDRDNAA